VVRVICGRYKYCGGYIILLYFVGLPVCWINVNCDDNSRTLIITVKLMKSKSCYFQSTNFPWAHGLLFFLINRHAYNLSLITLNPETSTPRQCISFLSIFIFIIIIFFWYFPFGFNLSSKAPGSMAVVLWKVLKTKRIATRLIFAGEG